MSDWRQKLADEVAVARSVSTYHADPQQARTMDALYAGFLTAGDLAFDIGAHVGDRTASFRRLGARVVAVEPQPAPAAVIARVFDDDADVKIVEAACASEPGRLRLRVNTSNPTVTTASNDFVAAADRAPGWEDQVWDREIEVEATTLDALIARYGEPVFAKIDVEGFEDQVLEGLTQPLRAVSIEFTTIAREVIEHAIRRLEQLGHYRYDFALGETHRLHFGQPRTADDIIRHIRDLPHEANSGDVYARLDR